jgi:KDO2-lipid IV(A) lauroyltransferase
VTPQTAARDRLVVAGYRAAVRLAGLVPPERAYPLLDAVADLVRLSSPGAREAVEANLEQVLGGRGRRHTWAVRGVFRHVLRNYYDTFRLPAMTDAEIGQRVVLHGHEHLRRALADGRGAILFSGHVSSVALAAQALALAERGGTVVVEPVQPPALLDLMLRVRGSHGLAYRTLGPGLFGDLAATLRRNELVFLVVDRDFRGTGSPVELFGRSVRVPTGPALLHLRTGAPILPSFVSRRPDGRLDGVVGAPLPIGPTGHRRAEVTEISRTIARRLEYHIGKHPEQWTVLQRVWES